MNCIFSAVSVLH